MRRLLALCLLAAITSVCSSARAELFDPLSVAAPFGSTKRLKNFIKRYEKYVTISDDFVRNALLVSEYGYRFEVLPCAKEASCAPGSIVGRAIKYSDFDLKFVEEEMRSAVASSRRSGCSYVNLDDPVRIALSDVSAIYLVRVRGAKRWCDNVLGTHTIATFEGRLTFQVNLQKKRVPMSGPEPGAGITVGSNITIDRKTYFGVFDSDGLIGQVLDIVFNVSKIVLSLVRSNELNLPKLELTEAGEIISRFVEEFHSASSAYSNFAEISEQVKIVRGLYNLATSETKLFALGDGRLAVRIASDAQMNWNWARYYYNVTNDEIRALRSLDEDEENHIVQRGDTLWTLAERKYGLGYYHHMVLEWNPSFANRVLRPGDLVTLKPFYELYGPISGVIKPGDSLWSRWKASPAGLTWAEFRRRAVPIGSKRAAKIYPLQRLAWN